MPRQSNFFSILSPEHYWVSSTDHQIESQSIKKQFLSVFKNFQQPSIELVCLCAGPHRVLLFATHQQFLLALLYSCLVPYVPRTSSASSVSPLSSLLSTALQSPVRHFTESFSMPNTLSWSLDTILHSNVFVTKLSEITLSCAM